MVVSNSRSVCSSNSDLKSSGLGVLVGLDAGALQVDEDTSRSGFGVWGKLALPRAIAGRPAEAVLFQRGACLLVGLLVKKYLEAVGFEVADDLATGEFCAFGGLLGLLRALVQLVNTGLYALDLAAQAGQFIVGDWVLYPRAALAGVGKVGGELGGSLGGQAGSASISVAARRACKCCSVFRLYQHFFALCQRQPSALRASRTAADGLPEK